MEPTITDEDLMGINTRPRKLTFDMSPEQK